MKFVLRYFVLFNILWCTAQTTAPSLVHKKSLDSVIKISEEIESSKEKIDALYSSISTSRYPKHTKILIDLSENVVLKSSKSNVLATTY